MPLGHLFAWKGVTIKFILGISNKSTLQMYKSISKIIIIILSVHYNITDTEGVFLFCHALSDVWITSPCRKWIRTNRRRWNLKIKWKHKHEASDPTRETALFCFIKEQVFYRRARTARLDPVMSVFVVYLKQAMCELMHGPSTSCCSLCITQVMFCLLNEHDS